MNNHYYEAAEKLINELDIEMPGEVEELLDAILLAWARDCYNHGVMADCAKVAKRLKYRAKLRD